MRARPIAVSALTALVATLALTACDDEGSGDKGNKKADSSASPPVPPRARRTRSDRRSPRARPRPPATPGASRSPSPTAPATTAPWRLPPRRPDRGRHHLVPRPGGVGEAGEADPQAGGDHRLHDHVRTRARGRRGQGAAVKTVKFGLPGAGAELSFPWKYGEVALRSASEPDASVGPLQRAGD